MLAVGSGVAYGTTTVLQRRLATAGVDAAEALTWRFGLAALLLGVVIGATGTARRPARGETLAVLVLGGVIYAAEAALFYAALGRGSAGAVTLVFYAYPAIVAAIEIVSGELRPDPTLAVALGAAAGGTALIVGTASEVAITPAGAALALAAATLYATYLVGARRFVRSTPPLTAAAWSSAALAATLGTVALWTGGLGTAGGRIPTLVGVGVAGAVAIGALFGALARIGAVPTAVVLNIEPVAAVVLGAALLSERITPPQLLGGGLVLAAAVLVTVSRPTVATEAASHHAP